MKFTTILHEIRVPLRLSVVQYTIIDYVSRVAAYSAGSVCRLTNMEISEWVGDVSSKTVSRTLTLAVDRGFLDMDGTGRGRTLRGTFLWHQMTVRELKNQRETALENYLKSMAEPGQNVPDNNDKPGHFVPERPTKPGHFVPEMTANRDILSQTPYIGYKNKNIGEVEENAIASVEEFEDDIFSSIPQKIRPRFNRPTCNRLATNLSENARSMLQHWFAHLSEKPSSRMTGKQLERILTLAAELDEDRLQAVIDHSITGGYPRLYFDHRPRVSKDPERLATTGRAATPTATADQQAGDWEKLFGTQKIDNDAR